MYLTRLRLNVSKRDTLKALSCPNLFHGAIESASENNGKRKLWRIDCLNGERYLMIVSNDELELSSMVRQFGFPDSDIPWESLCYDGFLERLKEGERWHFRLTANPTRSVSDGSGTSGRGAVYAHVGINNQIKWLLQHATKNGFKVKEDEVTVVDTKWYSFRKKTSTNHRVSLLSVTYEGIAEITDIDLFVHALTSGIGRGKAYGQGMITIAGR